METSWKETLRQSGNERSLWNDRVFLVESPGRRVLKFSHPYNLINRCSYSK